MPRKYTHITPQIVAKTKKYLEDDRNFSKAEIARLMGISKHSLNKIVQGYYDHPVEKPRAKPLNDLSLSHQGDPTTVIPFEKLEYLLKCEMFIDELFSMAQKSDKVENEIYFPRHYVDRMCERYFPVITKAIKERLNNDTNA